MCSFSSTIFSDSPKPAPKCLPCLDVSHQLSVISLPLLPIWVLFKKESQLPRRDLLLQFRLSMCQLTTWLTLPPLQLSLSWMPLLSCLELWLSWESTLQSILWILLHVSWTQQLWDKNTIPLLEVFRSSSRTTNHFKISLLFWVWTSCLRTISLL